LIIFYKIFLYTLFYQQSCPATNPTQTLILS